MKWYSFSRWGWRLEWDSNLIAYFLFDDGDCCCCCCCGNNIALYIKPKLPSPIFLTHLYCDSTTCDSIFIFVVVVVVDVFCIC